MEPNHMVQRQSIQNNTEQTQIRIQNPPIQNHNPSQQNIPENVQLPPNQEMKLTPQQQMILDNFFKLPYEFIPPPIITDINTTAYRENFQSFVQNNSSIYEMFQKKYSINTGKQVLPAQQEQQVQASREQNSSPTHVSEALSSKVPINYNESIKMKVNNLKFHGYTLFASMAEALKHFSALNLNTQRIKQIQGLLVQRVFKFYQLSEELKDDYRRYFILYKLQNQIAYLQKQTDFINQKLNQISNYVSKNTNSGPPVENLDKKNSQD